jgi:hypothetical protein
LENLIAQKTEVENKSREIVSLECKHGANTSEASDSGTCKISVHFFLLLSQHPWITIKKKILVFVAGFNFYFPM